MSAMSETNGRSGSAGEWAITALVFVAVSAVFVNRIDVPADAFPASPAVIEQPAEGIVDTEIVL